tara:strand:+ start:1500 stop:1751 length:252 start_codon:yes stop_codon:yes gene_type:complete
MSVELKLKKSKITIDLDGPEGNAFALMGYAHQLSRSFQLDGNSIIDKMTSGDYLNVLKVFDDNFGDLVVLETENAEYLEAFAK